MIIEPMEQEYDIADQARIKLISTVPEAFADGKILWEKLRESLGDVLDDDDESAFEHYGLSWPGKRRAKKVAITPSTLTLTPLKGEGINEENTQNIFIEGDNLEVLKILYKSYKDKIKMIYIDPPYNTGKDFIYNDDFRMSEDEFMRAEGTVDEQGNKLISNKKTSGRFHANWLNMMYPRLRIAKELLQDDGAIFISIDENEVHNLRMLCDEIFGEENFVECICWNKRIPKNDKGIGNIHEYILLYVKNSSIKSEFIMRKEGLDDVYELASQLKKQKVAIDEAENKIKMLYKKNAYDRGITLYNSFDDEYRLWGKINMSWPNAETVGPRYEVLHPGTKKPVKIPDRGWRWKEDTFNEAAQRLNGEYDTINKLHDGSYICGKIWFAKDENTQPSSITYLDEVNDFLLRSILSTKSDGGVEIENLFEGKNYFSYPKPTSLIKTLIGSRPSSDRDIYLDFFSGSGTTAHAIMKLNAEDGGSRKYICVQLPEDIDQKSEAYTAGFTIISDITKERLRRASYKTQEENPNYVGDLGFKVYKTTRSNHKKWGKYIINTPKEADGLFKEHEHSLVDGWEYDSVLTEVILTEGFPLTSIARSVSGITSNSITQISSADKEYALYVCLDDVIKPDTIKATKMNDNDVFVCLGSAIDDQNLSGLHDKGRIRIL